MSKLAELLKQYKAAIIEAVIEALPEAVKPRSTKDYSECEWPESDRNIGWNAYRAEAIRKLKEGI